MKVTSYAVARPSYYDRGAIAFSGGYADTLAPHAETVRISVTIAAGRKVLIEGVNASVTRATTAATLSYAQLYVNIQATAGFRMADILTTTNVLAARTREIVYPATTIYAGEVFTAATSDASTGGTNVYIVQYRGTDFTA